VRSLSESAMLNSSRDSVMKEWFRGRAREPPSS
jgi:hypothetical protein